ncbi:MAG: diphosphomevalonate decarboxylase, partial [Thermoplasmatota archaeon]
INGIGQSGKPLARVAKHLDRLRERAKRPGLHCAVASANNFAASAGLASSASAFAALTVAGFAALDAKMSARELSTYARLGSGSASRSIFGGFVEWKRGDTHESSYAEQIASADHFDLRDVVVVFADEQKKVGSSDGHGLAASSPLAAARIDEVNRMLPLVREGILKRDFALVGRLAELDALMMHGVMMTSDPPLYYWLPETIGGLRAVARWREEGLGVFATIDAGPNLHLLCRGDADATQVARRARDELGVTAANVIVNGPGGEARLVKGDVV